MSPQQREEGAGYGTAGSGRWHAPGDVVQAAAVDCEAAGAVGARQLPCSGRRGSSEVGMGNPIPVIAVSFLERWQSPPWMERLLSSECP